MLGFILSRDISPGEDAAGKSKTLEDIAQQGRNQTIATDYTDTKKDS